MAGLLLDLGRLRELWRATQIGWAWSENEGDPEPLQALELMRVWRFPPAVVAAIAGRHKPEEATEYRLLTRLVGLAAVCSADPVLQASGGGGPLLRAAELVKEHLPLLSLSRQLALAEMLVTESKRNPSGQPLAPARPDGSGHAHG
jgi:hypothetical protein